MKLFELTVIRAEQVVRGHLVAPSHVMASECVVNHLLALGDTGAQFQLKRIDQSVVPDRRAGLEAVLRGITMGFARFDAQRGWSVHLPPFATLDLFKVSTPEGQETFVIAESEADAAELYMDAVPLPDGGRRLFRIEPCLDDVGSDCRAGLAELVEYGPAGVVEFAPMTGWRSKHA